MMGLNASEIYKRQNNVIHKHFETVGAPYNQNAEMWKGLFQQITGRDVSLSKMNLGERHTLIDHFISCGFPKLYNPYVPPGISGWKKGNKDVIDAATKRPIEVPPHKRPLVGKIHALLTEMRLPWKYADTLAPRIGKCDFVEFCDLEGLKGIMVALKNRKDKLDAEAAAAAKAAQEAEEVAA